MKNKLMTTALSAALIITATVKVEAQEIRDIDVPAQPLDAAINELSAETGRAIIVKSSLVRGKTSRAVKGQLTPKQALMSMVAGTGLSFLQLPDRSFALTESGRQGVGSSQDGDFLLDEVVIVEGEKIGRSLQEITPSIVVLDDSVDRPQNLDQREAIQGIPNVLNEEGGQLPSIRGIDGSAGQIGGNSFTTGAQPRVPIIVDGVPRPLTIGATPSLNSVWDVEAIEVARGPQATTTGRNALGGAIRVQTKDPTNKFEAKARLNYFNQDGTLGGAFLVNVPIVDDQLAVRFTAEASDGETFVEVLPGAATSFPPGFLPPLSAETADLVEDEEFRRFRGKVLFTPDAVPGLSVKFSVDDSSSVRLFQPGDVSEPVSLLQLATFFDSTSVDDNEQTVYSGSVIYELSDRITVETKAAFLDNEFVIPPSNPLFDITQTTDTLTAEGFVRLNDFGRLSKGLFGVAYETQKDEASNGVGLLGAFSLDADIENIGIFGEAEVDLLERLTLIVGARVEIDERERFVALAGSGSDTLVEETAFIPKVGLRYDLTEDARIGYTYSEGFRPGGVDFDLFDPTNTVVEFDSERLRQHEIFAKTQWFDSRLAINGSAFFYTFEDAQTPGAAGVLELFGNVPEARGLGLELDGSFEVFEGVRLTGGLGLLDTEITDAGPNLPQFEGADLPRAPSITASAGLSYISDFGFSASLDARFVGAQSSFLGDPELDNYVVVDVSAAYEHEVSNGVVTRIDGFIKNLADNRFTTSTTGSGFVVGRPRTFGISGTISF
ncbi:MAG: TonB-dependent receptor [Pseudomonadota bacterium]